MRGNASEREALETTERGAEAGQVPVHGAVFLGVASHRTGALTLGLPVCLAGIFIWYFMGPSPLPSHSAPNSPNADGGPAAAGTYSLPRLIEHGAPPERGSARASCTALALDRATGRTLSGPCEKNGMPLVFNVRSQKEDFGAAP